MSRQAPVRRLATIGVIVAALCIPTSTLAQSTSSPPAELDALAAVELMNEVPEAIRASCMPTSATVTGAVAVAQCLHGGGLVLYVRFGDLPALAAAYDQLLGMTGLASDVGTGCAQGPFEGGYLDDDGQEGGRLVCQTGPDGPIAAWSDFDRLVLGLVQFPGGDDWAALESAWQTAQLNDVPGLGSPAPLTASPPSTTEPTAATATTASPSEVATSPGVPPSPVLAGETLTQWASEAVASSQYGSDSWSSQQATGAPNTVEYGDYPTAWAPSGDDAGLSWLELTYETPVVPTEIVIWETSGNGFVSRVQAWDDAAQAWVTLWEGQDGSPQFVVGFSPDLSPRDFATDRLRIDIDTSVPGWNEVDAVALIGAVPATP